MPELFRPEDETLPSIANLEAIAEVDEEDAGSAAQKWRDNPPDDKFKNILDADEVEKDG